ncbi:MAG: gliding motility-associated C-terminal domain-containing protein [Chitinophagaceae bacterium]
MLFYSALAPDFARLVQSKINFRILLVFLVSTLFCVNHTWAQPQTNNWFFGDYNGLSFSNGSPVVIQGGMNLAMEGASAISDKNGNLLFYTDGVTVWDRNHNIMSNGQSLAGGYGSSTQSCLIVPKTADGKQYYIFTTDQEGGLNGFEYSVVDLSLNNGLGVVIIKNQLLMTPCSEKVTAVRHCDKKDYWVITHQYGTDAYYAYLATETGINPTPVISHSGSVIPVTYATMAGQLKSSPDGKLLAAAHANIGIELSDFDNQTGIVSNTSEIFGNSNAHHYGVEFSASSQVLYTYIHAYWNGVDFTRHSGLFQFNLSLPDRVAIANSKTEIAHYDVPSDVSSLQRASNGKIYMSQFLKNYLSVINNPEVIGTGCNFTEEAVPLLNRCEAALPNFLNDYTASTDSFHITGNGSCVNTAVEFHYIPTGEVSALLWNFGDPASTAQNTSSSADPSHVYVAPGQYDITLIKYSPCKNDTLRQRITVGYLSLSLGKDTAICKGATITLVPQVSGPVSLTWQDGSIGADYHTNTPGLYWVEASDNSSGCRRRDSILVSSRPSPLVNLGKDTSLCEGESLQLNAFNSGATYNWQDGSNNPQYLVRKGGTYWAEVYLDGCMQRDSITIATLQKPQFSLGPDQFICPGIPIILSPGIMSADYLWQDGSTSNSYTVNKEGTYSLTVTNDCGSTIDSIIITAGNCTVRIPSAFSPNNDGLNDRFHITGTGLVSSFHLLIVDRYGNTIFESHDKNAYWDGTYKGTMLPVAVYVYFLSYTESGNSEIKKAKGTLLLTR